MRYRRAKERRETREDPGEAREPELEPRERRELGREKEL